MRSLLYGLWAGVLQVAFFSVFYWISPRLMLGPIVYWSAVAIPLYFMWKACEQRAKLAGQVPNFRVALQEAFLVYFVASFLYYIFYYVLFTQIDPNLINLQQTLALERLEQWGNSLDADQLAEMKSQLEAEQLAISIVDTFRWYVSGLIGGFILALFVALLYTRLRVAPE